MTQYNQLFEKSSAIEMILPRDIVSEEKIKDLGFDITKTKSFANKLKDNFASIDLRFFQKWISNPAYDMIK